MRLFLFMLVFLPFITSCSEGYTEYQMRIMIKNETDSVMTVKLYPKDKYMRYGKYSYSDLHTKYKDTAFIPDNKIGTELFSTDTLNTRPEKLATRVFDSIHVGLKSGRMLKLSPREAVNYRYNPFKDSSSWVYEHSNLDYVRMWRDNNLESDDYIFLITGIQ